MTDSFTIVVHSMRYGECFVWSDACLSVTGLVSGYNAIELVVKVRTLCLLKNTIGRLLRTIVFNFQYQFSYDYCNPTPIQSHSCKHRIKRNIHFYAHVHVRTITWQDCSPDTDGLFARTCFLNHLATSIASNFFILFKISLYFWLNFRARLKRSFDHLYLQCKEQPQQ